MVTQVSYPGVYIEEVPSSVHTITAVATSITAFLGRTTEGPINKAVRIQTLSDFEKIFGSPHPSSELSTAVKLFFLNGGTDCYVVRLVKKGTGQKASIVVKNEGSVDVLKFTAKEIGTWGNELAIEVDYNTSRPEDTYHLRIFRMNADGTIKDSEEFLNCSADIDNPRFSPTLITQDSKLVDCEMTFATSAQYKSAANPTTSAGYSKSMRPFANSPAGRNSLSNLLQVGNGTYKFEISVDDGPFLEVDLKDAFPTGSSETAILTALKSRINTALPITMPDSVNVVFDTALGGKVLKFESATGDNKSIFIRSAPSNDVAKTLMLGTDHGGIEHSRYGLLRPAPTGIFFDLTKLDNLADKAQNYFDSVEVDGQPALFLGNKLFTNGGTGTEKWYVSAGDKTDGVREKFAIIASMINDASIGWSATVPGSRLVLKKRCGSRNYAGKFSVTPDTDTPDANKVSNFFKNNARYYSLGSGSGPYMGSASPGVEGEPPDSASYKGSEMDHTGFYALDSVDLFNLMVIPYDEGLGNNYRDLWAPASTYCKSRRAFLLIDPPNSWSKSYSQVLDPSYGIRSLRIGVAKDHSAVYYPRLVVRENGISKNVGPCGAMAGVISRIDSAGGSGVWKAPAGVTADLQGGLSDLEVLLTDKENGSLNKEGVNCLRRFPSGIVSWGARTMAGADDFSSEWKYVPIRRLALLIEESLYRGTKWVVFEPNDEPLWAKIRLNVRAFMMGLFRQGAFQGGSPDKAFFVKCDGESTTQADRDLGIVNIIVGFAPLKPAEFVIIKIQQMAGEL